MRPFLAAPYCVSHSRLRHSIQVQPPAWITQQDNKLDCVSPCCRGLRVCRVIPLCLRHRLRKDPMADIDNGDRVREVFKTIFAME